MIAINYDKDIESRNDYDYLTTTWPTTLNENVEYVDNHSGLEEYYIYDDGQVIKKHTKI